MKTGESVMATSFFQMLNSGRTATERGVATYTTDGYAKVICDVIEDLKPEAFLIGATNLYR